MTPFSMPQVFLDKAEQWATQMERMMVDRGAAVSACVHYCHLPAIAHNMHADWQAPVARQVAECWQKMSE
jgi:hypothetical protein